MTAHRLRTFLEPGALSCNFQPVVRAEKPNDVYAMEALIRGPRGTAFEAPHVLFDYVRRKRAEAPIERECIRTVLCAAKELPPLVAIKINVHTSTIARDSDFAASLVRTCGFTGVQPSRLIIGLVEHGSMWNRPGFLTRLERLRNVGVRLAIDDFGGACSTSYRMILDTRPDFLKLDSLLCQGVARDCRRRAMISSVVAMADGLGTAVIAVGIDNRDDHYVLRDLGVAYLQGAVASTIASATGWQESASHDRKVISIR